VDPQRGRAHHGRPNANLAFVRLFEANDTAQGRGLTAATGSQDSEEFTFMNVQGELINGPLAFESLGNAIQKELHLLFSLTPIG
jgi:hypothetical protein